MVFSNFHKNCMGTMSFDATFKGMRKPQEFIVYPMSAGKADDKIRIQSDTRIGDINLITGEVMLSPGISSGAFHHHMLLAKPVLPLTAEELALIKESVGSTASPNAGSLGVTCDNSGAAALLAA
jgi:hypothetical protein